MRRIRALPFAGVIAAAAIRHDGLTSDRRGLLGAFADAPRSVARTPALSSGAACVIQRRQGSGAGAKQGTPPPPLPPPPPPLSAAATSTPTIDAYMRVLEVMRSLVVPVFSPQELSSTDVAYDEVLRALESHFEDQPKLYALVKCGVWDAPQQKIEFKSVAADARAAKKFRSQLGRIVDKAIAQGLLTTWPVDMDVNQRARDQRHVAAHSNLVEFFARSIADNESIRYSPHDALPLQELVAIARKAKPSWVTDYPDGTTSPRVAVVGTRTRVPDEPTTSLFWSRHVKVEERMEFSKYSLDTQKVIKIVGVAGCGKSTAALLLGAPVGTIVFYVHGESLAKDDNGDPVACIAKGRVDAKNVAESELRNDHVRNRVTAVLRDALEILKVSAAASSVAWDHSPPTVRVVVDEVGDYPAVTRALIAMHNEIRRDVASVLQLAPLSADAVQIFCVGTGPSAPNDPYGSARYASSYQVVDLCASSEEFEAFFFERLPSNIKPILEAASSSQNAAAAYRAILENPRMAALATTWNCENADDRKRRMAAKFPAAAIPNDGSIPAVNAAIGGEAAAAEALITLSFFDSTHGFVHINGMRGMSADEVRSVLADALAIDVCGYDAIGDAKTRDLLLVTCGVLQDRAQPESQYKGVAIRIVSGTPGSREALWVPDDAYGRYRMPAPYRALYLQMCFGELPRVHGGSDADGLERLLWQWSAILMSCATPELTAADLAHLLCDPYTVPCNGQRLLPRDLLQKRAFTKRLVADACVRHGEMRRNALCMSKGAVSCVRAALHVPYFHSSSLTDPFSENAALPSAMFVPHKHLAELASTAPAGHTAVSILNKDKAPYADVIAFMSDGKGVSTALLIQAKLAEHFSKTDMQTECAKVGLCPGTAAEETPTRKLARDWVGKMTREMGIGRGAGRFLVVLAGPQQPAPAVADGACPQQTDVRRANPNIDTSLVYFPTDAAGVLQPVSDKFKRPPLYPLFVKRLKS